MLRREVVKMAGSLFGLGSGTPSRFPYPDRPQPSPGVGPGASNVVRARQVIVSGPGGGIFVYNGTPGLGTLVQSITSPTTFTDPFGNAIIGTNTTYQKLSPTSFQAVAYQGNEIIFFTATSPAGPWASTGLFISFSASGPDGILLNASGGTIQLGVLTTGVQVSGTVMKATAGLSVTGGASVSGGTTTDTLTVSGTTTLNGVVTATAGTRASQSVFSSDSWTTFGAFAAGFGAGGIAPQQAYLPAGIGGAGKVALRGQIFSTAATAANSTMVTAMRGPTQNMAWVVPTNAAGYTPAAGSLPRVVLVDTAGNVRLQPTTSAANQFVLLDGIEWALG